MAVDVEKLIVQLSADYKQYENAMKRATGVMNRQSREIRRSWDQANRFIDRSSNVSADAIRRVAVQAAGLVGGLNLLRNAARGFVTSTDNFKTVENRLRSIGQTSDEALEKLLNAAIRSRSGVVELSTTVARIQKATGDDYDTTIRRVETLNKLLAVGGATTAEVSSVVTQLSQALTSGFLQGDELRSLREAAPVELLDAIAAAAGVSRGELKKLGEEGRLTSQVITAALDSLAGTADQRFRRTTQTVSQATTNLSSAFTILVGRFDEGLGASEQLVGGLQNMAEWAARNGDEAEMLGRSLTAALQTVQSYGSDAIASLTEMARVIDVDVKGAADRLGLSVDDLPGSFKEALAEVIAFIAHFVGAMEGSGAVIENAFYQMVDGVTGALQKSIDAVIEAVAKMVNEVLDGVRSLAVVIDAVTGSSLAEKVTPFKPGRGVKIATNLSEGTSEEVYKRVSEAAEKRVLDAVNGVLDGIEERFRVIRDGARAGGVAGGSGLGGGGGGGGGGRPPPGGGSGGGRNKADKEFNDLLRERDQLLRDIMTPLEAYHAELERIDLLTQTLDKDGNPLLTEEQANKARERLASLQPAAQAAAGALRSAFDGVFDDPAAALENLAKQLAMVALQMQLVKSFPGVFGDGGLIPLGIGAASGGYISGPGTGTSDSIPARLSNGEYVVNAHATRQNRALLDAINGGWAPGFAAGGYVGAPAIPAVTRGAAAPIVQIVDQRPAGSPDMVQDTSQTRGPDGRQMVRMVVSEDMARGRFNGPMQSQYGVRPQKVVR